MQASSQVCWQQYGSAWQTAAVHDVESGGVSQPGASGGPFPHSSCAHCGVFPAQLRLRQTVGTFSTQAAVHPCVQHSGSVSLTYEMHGVQADFSGPPMVQVSWPHDSPQGPALLKSAGPTVQEVDEGIAAPRCVHRHGIGGAGGRCGSGDHQPADAERSKNE